MDTPERGAAADSAPPKSLTERLKAEVNGYAEHIEMPAASFMAERFAPDLIAVAGPERTPAGDHPTGQAMGQARATVSPMLLAVLIAVALVPTLLFAFLVWQGAVELPWPGFMASNFSMPEPAAPPPALQEASAASSTVLETVLPKRDAELPQVALSLPSAIAAEAGKETAFAIALDSDDALPARSILTISGLPEGTIFSAGRPYGETEWSLRPDEIGDLNMQPPPNASGERALAVELVAADGRTIASAATKLEIAPDPKAALVLRPDDAARIGELIAHGNKMVEVGYVAGARSYFKRAAEAGSADAALALGTTYDPGFLAEIGARGIKPEPDEARSWYERAKLLGHKDADSRLVTLAAEEAAPPQPQADSAEPDEADDTAAIAPASAPGPTLTGGPEWIEIASPVNIRAAPTPEAETLKIAQVGMRYRATGRKGRWVQVTDPATSEVGWVYAKFVASSEAPVR
jgi:hypothetical protein